MRVSSGDPGADQKCMESDAILVSTGVGWNSDFVE
jgi:hypothetical protein